ncbi:MAG: hypothetical protein ACOCWI_03680 [Bacillota bacterium]
MYYVIGLFSAAFAGMVGFFGQILQKKAINNVMAEKGLVTMWDLFKNKLWLTGIACILVFTTVFTVIAQMLIGPALFPGLFATGFIVLALGSVKILGEKLKKEEYIAMAMLIIGIVFLSLSRLSIEADLSRFQDKAFIIRLSIFVIILFALWLGFYYGGKKSKKKAVLMALGSSLPFAIANLGIQPMIMSVESFFSDGFQTLTIVLFLITGPIVLATNLAGTVHFQKALAEGNASIIIPTQQIPQQLSPIFIYFVVYAMTAPSFWSYVFVSLGTIIIIFAGFLLSKRQTQIVKKYR